MLTDWQIKMGFPRYYIFHFSFHFHKDYFLSFLTTIKKNLHLLNKIIGLFSLLHKSRIFSSLEGMMQ